MTLHWLFPTILLLGSLVGLMIAGVPVAFAFLVVNLVGAWIFFGGFAGLEQMVDNSLTQVASFPLATAPLFVLMGNLFFHTGIALRVFDALDQLLGKLPGRLSYLTVAGGTLYSTLTGSSLANTAMLGSLMVPEMRKRGYSQRLSIGPILGTGGLAIIIPPSTAAVLLGTIANLDVGQVLIAGLIPGLVMAALYIIAIYFQVRLDPSAAPAYDVAAKPLLQRVAMIVRNLGPIAVLLGVVVGIIVYGVATPSESAAFGVVGVGILAGVYRSLSIEAVRKSLISTVLVTGMIFLILVNASTFSQLLAFSGASRGFALATSSLDMSAFWVAFAVVSVVLVMGMFMEPISIMLITVPIFYPLIQQHGYDLVAFSVVVLIAIEMGLTTPPFGILLFVMLGVAEPNTSLWRLATFALPYLFCALLVIVGVLVYPDLALFLPYLMK